MDNYTIILREWGIALELEKKSYWWDLLKRGELRKQHYMGYLRETYHYTSINPQTQAYATMFFDKNEHRMISDFLRHAAEEISHDKMALRDLVELGADESAILSSRPAPMTTAFSAIPFYLLQFDNPVAYLGHIFHLEFIATQNGPEFIDMLNKIGINISALTFIQEHANIDPRHNKMMVGYINALVKSKNDLDAVIFGVRTACRAYSIMLSDACLLGAKDFNF